MGLKLTVKMELNGLENDEGRTHNTIPRGKLFPK